MKLLTKLKDALTAALMWLMPSCREALRLQSEALEHPLPPARRAGLWLHLQLCKWCRQYGRQIRFLQHAAHQHPEEFTQAASHRLSPEARQRIREKLRASQG